MNCLAAGCSQHVPEAYLELVFAPTPCDVRRRVQSEFPTTISSFALLTIEGLLLLQRRSAEINGFEPPTLARRDATTNSRPLVTLRMIRPLRARVKLQGVPS